RKLFRDPNITHHPRDDGDDLRRFDTPDRVDRSMELSRRHAMRVSLRLLRLILLSLGAQTILLSAKLRRKFGTEIIRLENRAEFDLAFLERTALQPFDGLFHRAQLPDPETGDQFLGLGEGSV